MTTLSTSQYQQVMTAYSQSKLPQQNYGAAGFGWRLGDFLLNLFDSRSLEAAFSECDKSGLKKLLDIKIENISADSRDLGAGSLFMAVSGKTYSSSQNIADAVANGAIAVIAESDSEQKVSLDYAAGANSNGLVPVILVGSLKQKLSEFARCFFSVADIPNIIGVTGTNGKTSCAWMLAQAVAKLEQTTAVVGTLGYGKISVDQEVIDKESIDKAVNKKTDALQKTGYTTPNAVEVQRIIAELALAGCDVIAMEISSHALSQWRVAAVDIKTAIFTNISHDHLDYHNTLDEYAEAKASLFKMGSVRRAVINVDDTYAPLFIASLDPEVTYLTYGVDSERADVRVLDARFDIEGIHANVLTPLGELDLSLNLIGRFNLSNALAVIAGLLINGKTLSEVKRALEGITPPPGRAQRISAAKVNGFGDKQVSEDIVAVVDFAHTPDALKNILISLKDHCAAKLWCVFGCGGDRDKAKRAEMAKVAESIADKVVVTRDNSRSEAPASIIDDICAGFSKATEVMIESDRDQAIKRAILEAGAGDVVLIAGKGHEDYIEESGRRIPFLDSEHVSAALQTRMERAA